MSTTGFWRFLKGVILKNDVDQSKTLTLQVSNSATTSTDTTLQSSQTANRVLTLPDATDTLVGRATTDTLTNKTFTSPVINTPTGITKSDVGLGNVDNTSDATKNSATATLTNKSISGSTNTLSNIADGSLSTPYIKADGSRTLSADWDAGAHKITANSVQVGSAANTISALSTIVNTGTLTLPTTTDTLIGRVTTDTGANRLKNKDLESTTTFIVDPSDTTRKIRFFTGNIGTGRQMLLSADTVTGSDATVTIPGVTTQLVGRDTTDTLTNKTLTGPTISDYIELTNQSSTPSTPGTAKTRFYSKTDKTLYFLDDNGVEQQVGSGTSSGGTDGINRIANGDIKITTLNAFHTYSDPAAVTPGDGITKTTNNVSTIASNVINLTAHGFNNGDQVKFQIIGTGASFPTGIVFATRYFVVNKNTNDFQISSTSGGAALTLGTSFTGLLSAYPAAGGPSGIAISRSTTSALEDPASLLFTKSGAANKQGAGFSADFLIANGERYSVFKLDVTKIINSGTFVAGSDSTDSDVEIFVYDAANDTVIIPSTIKLFSNSTTVPERYIAVFQTTDSNQYRLIWHVRSTSTSDYELKTDLWSASRGGKSVGPIVQDWQSYTLTIGADTTAPTPGTNTKNAYWRRVGDSMEVRFDFDQTAAGSAGSGQYLFPLPTGYTIDSNKTPVTGNGSGNRTVGAAGGRATTINGLTGTVKVFNTTNLMLEMGNETSTPTVVSSTFAALSNALVRLSFEATVPISGWASQVQMSSDMGATLIDVDYNASPPTGTISSSDNVIKFGTKITDLTGSYSTTTGLFTAPVSGYYNFTGACAFAETPWTALSSVFLKIYVRGSEYARSRNIVYTAHSADEYAKVSALGVYMASGDTAGLYSNVTAGSPVFAGAAVTNYFQVTKSANPAPILLSELPRTTVIIDRKSAGSDGGTFTSGAMRTRDLNLQQGDTSFATLASNQITLTAGSYWIDAFLPAFEVGTNVGQLFNTSDSTVTLTGTENASPTASAVSSFSRVVGSFSITSTKTFELQHKCTTTGSGNGFGNGSALGAFSVYATVLLTKVS